MHAANPKVVTKFTMNLLFNKVRIRDNCSMHNHVFIPFGEAAPESLN
jgi:hypothetical protein